MTRPCIAPSTIRGRVSNRWNCLLAVVAVAVAAEVQQSSSSSRRVGRPSSGWLAARRGEASSWCCWLLLPGRPMGLTSSTRSSVCWLAGLLVLLLAALPPFHLESLYTSLQY
jgi:hypothetical protein